MIRKTKTYQQTHKVHEAEEELALMKEFGALLNRLSRQRPCLALTGMCQSEILRYKKIADRRAADTAQYLSENP